MKIYQVGGSVRDALLGLTPKDIDYVVVGATPSEMLAQGFSQVGATFPVFLHPETREEYALARKEQKIAPGYSGFAVRFDPDVSLEDDLFRRDLTINAMAIDLTTGDLIDPFNGQQDLVNKVLKHVSEAFAEDPVRVLRVARFAARYTDFTIDPQTIELMEKIAPELNHVPKERIWAEIAKGLMEQSPWRMFEVLFECRALCSGRAGGVDALAPYEGADLVALRKTSKDTSLDVKFALVGRLFGRDPTVSYSYDEWCIPTPCARLNELANFNTDRVVHYDALSNEHRLQLLTMLKVFNSDQCMVDKLLDVAAYYMPSYNRYMLVKQLIHRDVKNLQNVNAEKIAFACKDGKEIIDQLWKARLQALDSETP